jgi:probable O-glycosylation ligase (exosortase A-associated)
MRDVLITSTILGLLPFALRRPWVGCILYVWVSIMNPHRLTWGFAYDFPFAMIVGMTIILGLFISPDRKHFPLNGLTATMLLLTLWMNVTLLTAIDFNGSLEMWDRVMKNMLMVFIALTVLNSRKHIDILIWILVISIGFFSIKGGFFTIATGGQFRVYGPPQGVINENNALAVATIMIIPLMRYLQLHASHIKWISNKWIGRGLMFAMGMSAVSALGSQSRGALLAISAMAVFFWLKSRHKLVLGIVIAAVGAGALAVMSDKWEARMRTIETYEDDGSAQGRLVAWSTMWNLAKDRPLVGGGFEVGNSRVYSLYSDQPGFGRTPVAHSIYFQMLGEHGFVGLGLFLLMGLLCWRYASWIIRHTRERDDLKWAHDLAAMIQVSFISYAVGGAFLNLAHFELPYYMALMLVLTRNLVTQATSGKAVQAAKSIARIGHSARIRQA